MSYTKDSSCGFLTSWWVVHSWSIDRLRQYEVVVYYLLIRRMTCLDYQDAYVLICITTH